MCGYFTSTYKKNLSMTFSRQYFTINIFLFISYQDLKNDGDDDDNEDEYDDDGDSGGVLLSDLIGKDKLKPTAASAAPANARQKAKQVRERRESETENESESESESDEEQHDRLLQSLDKFYRSADSATTTAKGKKGE